MLQFITSLACVSNLNATENSRSNKIFVEETKTLNLGNVLISHCEINNVNDSNNIILTQNSINSPRKEKTHSTNVISGNDITISPSKIFFGSSSIIDFDRYTANDTRNSTGKKLPKKTPLDFCDIKKNNQTLMFDSSVLKKNDIEKISQYIDEHCQPLGAAKKCLYSRFNVSISNYQFKTSEGMAYNCIEEYNDQNGRLVAWILTSKNRLGEIKSRTKYVNDFSYKKALKLMVHNKNLELLHDVFKEDDVQKMIPYLNQAGFVIVRSGRNYYATLDKYENGLCNDSKFPLRGSQADNTKDVDNSIPTQDIIKTKKDTAKSTSIEKIKQKVQPMHLNEQQILKIKLYLMKYGQPVGEYEKTIGLNRQNHALLDIWKYFDNEVSAIATPLRNAGFVIITQRKNQFYYISLPEYKKENCQQDRWKRLDYTTAKEQQFNNISLYIEKFGTPIRNFSKAVRLQSNNTELNKLLKDFVPDYLTNVNTLKKVGFEIVKCVNASYITSLKYKIMKIEKSKIEERLANLHEQQEAKKLTQKIAESKEHE